MSGEPQPGGGPDRLDRALFALQAVWLGLFAGAVVITALMIALVTSNEPFADLGELGYLFLLAVPVGLFGAFVVAPMVASKDPREVVRSAPSQRNTMYAGWEGTKPDEAYYWFPAFVPAFFVKAGMLEGNAILCAIGFLLTGNWVVLGGAVLLIAVLAAQAPMRSAVEAFAADARQRMESGGAG